MSWRTVYVQNANKLSLNLNNLLVEHKNEQYNVNLDDIDTIIVEDYKCIITARLLMELCEQGISVIFTKMNKMPVGSLHSFANNARTAKYSKMQLNYEQRQKQVCWKQIIEIKISSQAEVLRLIGEDNKYLLKYVNEVELGDLTNKEGQAARVYFKKLFGSDFIRFDPDIINYCLNYCYQIIRSQIAQEIVARGLHPSFGIYHRSEYNYYNFADDLIEVYRPIVDFYIYEILKSNENIYLTPQLKEELVGISYYFVKFGEQQMKLNTSIKLYVNNVIKLLEGKSRKIKDFPEIVKK